MLDNHWMLVLFSASWTELGLPTFSLLSSDFPSDRDCVEFDHHDYLWWISLWPRAKVAAGSCHFLGGHFYCWVRRRTQLFMENEQNGNCVRSASALWDFLLLVVVYFRGCLMLNVPPTHLSYWSSLDFPNVLPSSMLCSECVSLPRCSHFLYLENSYIFFKSLHTCHLLIL